MAHIETERLRLRAHIETDRGRYLEALNDWSVAQWFFGIAYPHSDSDFEARALELVDNHSSGKPSMFAVALKADETFLGCVTIENTQTGPQSNEGETRPREMRLGYWYHPQAWGQGYAKEAALALLDYARDTLGLKQVFATADPANPVSLHLLESLGFTPAGSEERSQNRRSPVTMQRFQLDLAARGES